MLPDHVAPIVRRYLRHADRLLPGRVTGFYVVGSTALGASRAGRSDVDFVAIVDRGLDAGEVRRLRALHAVTAGGSALRAAGRGQVDVPGTCNGVFVAESDVARPVTEITPIASHTGHEFSLGSGFDVNPVMWKVLAERAITVRGPAPETLGLQPQPELLRPWNLENLDAYWRRWAERLQRRPGVRARLRPRWTTSWGVLGAPRLHCTIATGEVVSKDAGGVYALDVFDRAWHPIVREGLAYWRGGPPDPAFRDLATRARHTAGFVLEVVRSAKEL